MDKEECFYRLYLGYQRFGEQYPEILGVAHDIEEMSWMYNAINRARIDIGYKLIQKLSKLGISTSEFIVDKMDFRLGKNWHFCVKQNGKKFIAIKMSETSSIFGVYIDEDVEPVITEDVTIVTTQLADRVVLSTKMKTEDEYVDVNV